MRKVFVFCLLPMLLSACMPLVNGSPEAGNSGVNGQVLIGPMCPVMQEGVPCPDQPYQASLTVLDPDGRKIMRFETDAQGRFEVNLSPGEHILHAESLSGQSPPYAADIPFTIQPDEFTTVIVSFDSGIR